MALPFKNGLVFKRSSSRLIAAAQNIRKELAVQYKHQLYHEPIKMWISFFLSGRERSKRSYIFYGFLEEMFTKALCVCYNSRWVGREFVKSNYIDELFRLFRTMQCFPGLS